MKQFDFVKNKKYAFMFSITLFIIFAIMFVVNGLTLDVTFKGGTRMMIESVGELDPNKAGSIIEQAIGRKVNASVTKTYAADTNEASVDMLRLDIAGNDPLTAEEEEKVREVLSQNFQVKLDSDKYENVSITATIGRETLQKGILAVTISSILILFYVAWRFSLLSGFSAAACAIIALLHDVGIMFGVYTVFKIPVNEIFIATILTVIGYSMNDTVVIYDRIRENTRLMKKSLLSDIVNVSTNQSLSRSINTSVTTLICVVTLYILSVINNVGSLKDFSFALIIGVATGTYSSIFIATPLWLIWKERKQRLAVK